MTTGAEAITAIQLIDACIGITSTIINIGNAVKDAQGLPPKLKELSEKIPAIDDLLSDARQNCEEGKVSESAAESAKPLLQQCEKALSELRDIFRKACPKDGENRGKLLWKGTRAVFLGRESNVQKLLNTIQGNLRLLEQKTIYDIGDKLDELQQITEELGHDDPGKYAHSGSGNIVANEGGSPTNYIHSGTGHQISTQNNYQGNQST